MCRLGLNRLGVPSVMRAEHLCQWLHEATQEEYPDTTNWKNVVAIVQVEFINGALSDKSTFQTVVLIPKRDIGDFRGIGLFKVLCKTVTGLLNQRFTTSITFHYALYGFRVGHGTGTAAFGAKLLQQLASMRKAVLYEVFLDLQKAYDSLCQGSFLEIISVHRVRPRDIRLLRTYWVRINMVARARGYYVPPFKV